MSSGKVKVPSKKTIKTGVCPEGEKPSVLFVDPLAGNRGHLLDDDLYLSECILPLTRDFLAATSSLSALKLRHKLGVDVWETPPITPKARLPRLRLIELVLSLPCGRFSDVIFQSFEEVSTLLFMVRHPSTRVHLIVTNNLRPDRLKRHPVLGRFFLRAVFQRATSIFVHTRHEVNKIRGIAPRIAPDKIYIKPFHQFSAPRALLPWDKKSNTVLFLGPELAHKQTAPVLDLIKADKEHRYRYIFSSMDDRIAPQTRAFLETRENVEVRFGYVSQDEYARLFSEAALVVLTHDKDFEGTLSGAFCDAIASGTPVIARDMAPHNEFFESFGPMGFLVDYSDARWCGRVLQSDLAARYLEFQECMAACRESCSMESIRQVFHAALARP